MNRHRWKGAEKGAFLKRLGTFLDNGYTLSAGIELLTFSQSELTKAKLREIVSLLRSGIPFYRALETLHYPKDILSFLYFSEQYGDLANGLKEAGEIYLERERMKEKLRKLIRYPLVLSWILVLVSVMMVRFLFPHFQELFASMAIELPLITVLFLRFINGLPFFLFLLLSFATVFAIFYVAKLRHVPPHKKISFLLRIPVVSQFLTSIITYYFSLQLSALMKGGVSIHQALTIFETQEHLPFFQTEASVIKNKLQQGETLAKVIKKRKHFLKELPLVIQHGQEQGQLAKELHLYSELLFQTIEEKTKKIIMIVQPLLFSFIGLVVLFMFASILIPLFHLISSIE